MVCSEAAWFVSSGCMYHFCIFLCTTGPSIGQKELQQVGKTKIKICCHSSRTNLWWLSFEDVCFIYHPLIHPLRFCSKLNLNDWFTQGKKHMPQYATNHCNFHPEDILIYIEDTGLIQVSSPSILQCLAASRKGWWPEGEARSTESPNTVREAAREIFQSLRFMINMNRNT